VIVGVNRFVDEQKKDEEIDLTRIDPHLTRSRLRNCRR